ncbi:MAG: amidohydrolase [Proteobacteria bacterium]|nr:amidohydrolase [Pseudomonadota bacterium]
MNIPARPRLPACLCAALLPCVAGAADLHASVESQLPSLVQTYKHLHEHPELSHHEEQTSALLAGELRKAGYEVTEHVGKYPDGSPSYGLVGLLKNGKGPTLLIRADMDALPVTEETGLPYASHVKAQNAAGQEVGVMHACGHDVHTTTLIGTARALAQLKSQWHGTLMLVGQPSEETIDGAKAMMADGLYARFGKPDMAIALHDTFMAPAGTVQLTSGPALSASSSIDVIMRGVGGHGSAPQLGKDPIVMAAQFINQVQTVVSRQEDPRDPVVITVGSIHGGTKRNIIPNEVKMEITARTFNDKSREIMLDGIRRAARGIAIAAGVPEDRMPIVENREDEYTPVTYNDPALTARIRAVLVKTLGAGQVEDVPPYTGSEDFGHFGLGQTKIPTVIFWLGAMDPAKFAAAKAEGRFLPGLHSSRFEPLPEPTLRTGVTAMTGVALNLLGK